MPPFSLGDVADWLRGLDASIAFDVEKARPENVGKHFVDDTINVFANFFSVYTSMADIIGLGFADSLTSCNPDSRLIELRVGRKDATAPGPPGVPKPEDDLATATAAFAKAGFSPTEMIQAVACGHSVGAVHGVNFPQIADPTLNTSTNLDVADTFDTTSDVFDNTNVIEYLHGTGKKGGPLVAGYNVTTRSDLRIFSSDNNITINAMSSPQAFEDTCYTIFEKLLDTVPNGVNLSDPIAPRPWTMLESSLDLSPTGAVSFAGKFTSWSKTGSPPATASYFYSTVGGGNTGPQTSAQGVPFQKRGFGTISNYAFNNTLKSPNIISINVQNSYTTPINQNLFILIPQTFRADGGSASGGPQWIIRAAVLGTLTPTNLTATLYYPARQDGTISPKLSRTTGSLTYFKTFGSYEIFQGMVSIDLGVAGNGLSYVDVRLGKAASQISAKVATSKLGICGNDVVTTC